jgi:nucleoid-associated protein YgaU
MDAMQAMMISGVVQPGSLRASLFRSNSRYYGLDTATLTTPAGKTVIYLRRRFVPSPTRFALLQEHTVTQGDRLDNITANYLGDPEQFWRVADANNAMNPVDLVEPPDKIGSKLKITLPEDIAGMPNA